MANSSQVNALITPALAALFDLWRNKRGLSRSAAIRLLIRNALAADGEYIMVHALSQNLGVPQEALTAELDAILPARLQEVTERLVEAPKTP